MLISIIQKIRSYARKNLKVRIFIAYYLTRTPIFDLVLFFYSKIGISNDIISKALESPDLHKIPVSDNSGKITFGIQKLHHNVKVIAGSYYGPENALLMRATKGIHEPQEEWAYLCILNRLKERKSERYHILELGAFWGFYSIWFLKYLANSTALLIEPDSFNIISGKKNAKLNRVSSNVNFINAFIGENVETKATECPVISIDSLEYWKEGKRIDILHSDIQGYELEMLYGAKNTLLNNLVDYVFISTHSDIIHLNCLKYLTDLEFNILAEHNVSESYSNDGLIVASSKSSMDCNLIEISKRKLKLK
jgi:hypothetical protein